MMNMKAGRLEGQKVRWLEGSRGFVISPVSRHFHRAERRRREARRGVSNCIQTTILLGPPAEGRPGPMMIMMMMILGGGGGTLKDDENFFLVLNILTVDEENLHFDTNDVNDAESIILYLDITCLEFADILICI